MTHLLSGQDLRNSDGKQPSVYRMLTDEEKRRLETPLILGTTYTLNQSETKKVSIGLQPRANGIIQPIIKLQNNTMTGGLVFEATEWNLLQTQLSEVSKYFKEGGQKIVWGSTWRTPSPIEIGEFQLMFTSSYGAKSIVFDRRTTAPIEPCIVEASEPKKRKNYSPAVVMQKTSFDGLMNIVVCLDERFKRLQRNITHVQKCVEILCSELLLYIPETETPDKINDLRVKELITNNFKVLRDAVKLRLDPSFVELTFGIVFLELTVLCVSFITNELKKSLSVKTSV